MNSHNTYSLFISERGLPTVISHNSRNYPDFIMSQHYREDMTGSYRECQDRHDEILDSFIDQLQTQETE